MNQGFLWRLAQAAEEARSRSGTAGIQPPPSFRRRPESSDLIKTFPQRGNANYRHDYPARHPIKPVTHSLPHPRFPGFLGRLFPTRLYHLGGLFPTPLYRLHPCRCASMQASFRWNDDGGNKNITATYVVSKSAPYVTAGFSGRRHHPGFLSQAQVGPRENPRVPAAPRSPVALFRADI